MKKRLLSLALAVVLLLGIFPSLSISADAAVTRYWPVPGHTSLSRGYISGHPAIDVNDGSINGATVVASVGGTVYAIYKCGVQHYGSNHDCNGFGTGIVIKGDDGWYYQYAHMQAGSMPGYVYHSGYISAGQMVGRVGTTGNSTGPHLHFQISSSSSWGSGDINPQGLTYTYSVPSSNYLDLGDDFYAYIKFPATGHGVCYANGNDVRLGVYGSQESLWRFVRQSNGSYKIISTINGTVMDVTGGNTANETNLQTYTSNDTIAQRFYIQAASDKYNIIAANCLKAVDVKDGSNSTVGTNVHIFSPNGSTDQIFEINKTDSAVVADGWTQEGGKWYYYQNGDKVKNQWKKDSVGWCYLSESGEMATNRWVKDSAGWCYVGSNGYMVTNRWVKDSAGWCWLDGSGHMAKNQWLQSGSKWYYLDGSGYMVTGTYIIEEKTNQFATDGVWKGTVAYTGWLKQGGAWYYFNKGAMHIGWLQQGNKWYCLNTDGTMIIGWASAGNDWYYFNSDGVMVTGWLQLGNNWYYLGGDGIMVTGWLQQGGAWYYLSSDGTMLTGWATDGSDYYYFFSNGVMATGWQQIDGQWYHFASNGICQ